MKDRFFTFLAGWLVRPLFTGMATLGLTLILLSPLPWNSDLLRALPENESVFTLLYLAACWTIGIFVITYLAIVEILRDLWRCEDILP